MNKPDVRIEISKLCRSFAHDGRIQWFDELDVTKERIRRLRFRSKQTFPASFAIPGALHIQIDGSLVVASVAATSEADIEAVCARYDASIEIEELNLEETFIGVVSVGANAWMISSLMLCIGSINLWSTSRLPNKGKVTNKTGLVNLLIALPIGAFPFLVLASRFFRPMLVEDYLMSGHVLIPIAFFAIAACLSWLAFGNLQSRLRERLEFGLPVVLCFHDLQAQSAEWAQTPFSAVRGAIHCQWE